MYEKEILKMIDLQINHCKSQRIGDCMDKDCSDCSARVFYNAGYRKESDTAREILEQMKFLIEERNCVGGYDLEDETIDGTIFVEVLNEIADRYGVDLTEDKNSSTD